LEAIHAQFELVTSDNKSAAAIVAARGKKNRAISRGHAPVEFSLPDDKAANAVINHYGPALSFKMFDALQCTVVGCVNWAGVHKL